MKKWKSVIFLPLLCVFYSQQLFASRSWIKKAVPVIIGATIPGAAPALIAHGNAKKQRDERKRAEEQAVAKFQRAQQGLKSALTSYRQLEKEHDESKSKLEEQEEKLNYLKQSARENFLAIRNNVADLVSVYNHEARAFSKLNNSIEESQKNYEEIAPEIKNFFIYSKFASILASNMDKFVNEKSASLKVMDKSQEVILRVIKINNNLLKKGVLSPNIYKPENISNTLDEYQNLLTKVVSVLEDESINLTKLNNEIDKTMIELNK